MRQGREAGLATLIRALDEESALVRFLAATTLRKIGPPAAAAIPRLTRALKDPDENTRDGAARALASIRGK